jgi:TRAP-type uncharacterized transport system fused permease subunit
MIGQPQDIVLAVITAAAGVWFCSAGIMGYFRARLSVLRRVVFVVVGALMLTPAHLFPGAIWLDIAGVIAAVAIGIQEYRQAGRAAAGRGTAKEIA